MYLLVLNIVLCPSSSSVLQQHILNVGSRKLPFLCVSLSTMIQFSCDKISLPNLSSIIFSKHMDPSVLFLSYYQEMKMEVTQISGENFPPLHIRLIFHTEKFYPMSKCRRIKMLVSHFAESTFMYNYQIIC